MFENAKFWKLPNNIGFIMVHGAQFWKLGKGKFLDTQNLVIKGKRVTTIHQRLYLNCLQLSLPVLQRWDDVNNRFLTP